MLWATSAEQMKRSAQRGNPPTRKSLFNDAELLAKNPAYPAQLRSLESSRPRPRTPYWNEIENAFGIFLSKANSGELSPADAMNQANAEIEAGDPVVHSRIDERQKKYHAPWDRQESSELAHNFFTERWLHFDVVGKTVGSQ